MNDLKIISLVLGLLMGAIHYSSDKLKLPEGANRYRVISFAAGTSIVYLFFDLLPHAYEAAAHLKKFVLEFLLLGFVIFHLAEKNIYKLESIIAGSSCISSSKNFFPIRKRANLYFLR